MPCIDWLILTAANRAQARGYDVQLRRRAAAGDLPGVERWRVIADPAGRRVGSGGATAGVLHDIAQELLADRPEARSLAGLFRKQRIVIVHSGGDSRRLPAYAAQGKVFMPLPCDTQRGSPAAMFDLMLDRLARLPAPEGGQVLVASGDVLLTFDPANVAIDRPGIVGVAYPAALERGSRHGVYVADARGRVQDFLQKPDEMTARRHGAVDAVGRVLVDTGLVSFDPAAAQRLLTAFGVKLHDGKLRIDPGVLDDLLRGDAPAVDLYEQVMSALPEAVDQRTYLERVARDVPPAHRKRLAAVYRTLHRTAFTVNALADCEFFHIGATRELLGGLRMLGRTAQAYGFANGYRSDTRGAAGMEGAFVYNTLMPDAAVRCGAGCVIESSDLRSRIVLQGDNVIVGMPADAATDIRLPAGWGLVCIPLTRDMWTAVLFGVDDDFKTPAQSGGTFGNRPMVEQLARLGIDDAGVLPRRTDATLWDAKLWPIGRISDVLRDTLWLCHSGRGKPPIGWRRAKRLSMAQILRRVDHRRLIAQRADIQRRSDLHQLAQRLAKDDRLSASSVVESVTNADEAALALQQVAHALCDSVDSGQAARMYQLAYELRRAHRLPTRRVPMALRGDMVRGAMEAVARGVAREMTFCDQPRKAAVLPDQVVWVTTPVRLDFAGGWSDTPPVCTDLGGAVVNAAITLNGQYPVQVMAKLTETRGITLRSIDQQRRTRITTAAQANDFANPARWDALPRAALVLAGLVPHDSRASLRPWLDALGGGLDITLFSAVPKGSGLGTSSVLGAAMLACLARIVGEQVTTEQLIARTSMLEQLMTTGGGWQDQVGGITPGVKIIRTQPGADQTPRLQWCVFDRAPQSAFRRRLLLYYTGYQRMAKNILQNVVSSYLARDTNTLEVVDELKLLAEAMKQALDARDMDAFGRGVEAYWSLKKRIDPGSTNARIEGLLDRVGHELLGKVLPGAGGGGFVFMVARSVAAAERVRAILERKRPNRLARLFEFDIDGKGLNVSVL